MKLPQLVLVLVLVRSNEAQRTVCRQEAVADLVFLVDGSWSIGTQNFEQIRRFLGSLVQSFDVGLHRVRVGLVQYSTTPRTEFYLNTYHDKDSIQAAIQNLPYMGGGTHTGLGLNFLLDQAFTAEAGSRLSQKVPQVAVVITDGKSQDGVEEEARRLKERGVLLFAVGIKDADEEQLTAIAHGNVYSVHDFSALSDISLNIVHTLCTSVEEAQGLITQLSTECTRASVADVVFLVDGSTSIGTENFEEMRSFLKTVMSGLDIGEDKVRVGLAQYSNDPVTEFLLKDHVDKQEVLQQLDQVPYRLGGTETGKALDFIRTQFFTAEAGSRLAQRVPQIAVVITDGDSTDQVLASALLLRRLGVLVFAIGVGQSNEAQLREIASQPQERFLLKIDSYQALQRLTEGLLQMVCVSAEDTRLALSEKFADIFFLVDSGLSVQEFQQVKGLMTRLLTSLPVAMAAHRVGVAQYGSSVKVEFLLNSTQTKEQTLNDVRRIRTRKLQPNEPRNLGAALEYASKHFFLPAAGGRAALGYRQFLVVVSGTASSDSVYKASRLLRSSGISVVGLSQGAPLSELKVFASPQQVYQLQPNLAPDLKTLFETQEVDSAVSGDCSSARLADVVFIVDESGSIGTPNFQLVRRFLHSVVSGLEVAPHRVRVGVVTYNDRATAQVFLDSFSNKTDLLSFLKILPYHGGGTSTGKALNFTRETIFRTERGSRMGKGVQQVAVVITDGESQDDVSAAGAELRRAGVTVYALGVKNANEQELHKMASYPAPKHTFIVNSFSDLTSVAQVLQKTLCHNILREAISVSSRQSGIKEGCAQTDEADIFFLIDHSGSIFPSDFHDMKKFILEFLQTFRFGPDHVRLGVAKFADDPELEFDLNAFSDSKSLEAAVLGIRQVGGGTETGKALTFMGPVFKRAAASRGNKVPEYLIVITDGKSSDEVQASAAALRSEGVTIYAIGVKSADQEELLQISGDTSKMFFVQNFDALKPIKDDIITDICSTSVCEDASGDLVFLVDSSGSIYPEDYKKMKEFMKSVIGKSSVGPDHVHFGVIQFSTEQQVQFPLNQYFTKDQMVSAVDTMEQVGGGTHTGEALAFAQQYFTSARGGRPALPQRLVVITDGEAQDEVKGPAKRLRDSGVQVYAIGVVDANTTQLLEISGDPERVFSERDFDGLKNLENQLSLEICNPDRDCKKTEKADIVFLVDGSTSITLPKFRSMQKFMSSLVNETTVGPNLTHFGVILYSNEPNSVFSLNRYSSKRDVLKAISALTRPTGDTYTGKALDYSLQYFGPQQGGRAAQRVPQLLMVITDGDATDRYSLEAPAQALARSGVGVFSIGVEGANQTQLEIMAGHNKNRVFYVDNFEALETLYKNISYVICADIKPECEKQQADLVFLLDQSGSILYDDYRTMKNFTAELVRSFNISHDRVRVALAQFSSSFEHQLFLNEKNTEEKVVEHILGLRQLGGGTNIGHALNSLQPYFTAARGSRKAQQVSQNLVLITDGESQDAVEDAALRLRRLGVELFVIGVGHVHKLELLQITGSTDRLFTVHDFGGLETIKKKVVDTICKSRPPLDITGCSIEVALGFDVSHGTGWSPGTLLLQGQLRLQTLLPDLLHYLSTVPKLCCTQGTVTPNMAFHVLDAAGQLIIDTNFEPYKGGVASKIMELRPSQPSLLNSAYLLSFKQLFQKSKAGVKVLVLFSDGLDEDLTRLQEASQQLLDSGVSSLLVVALEGAKDVSQMQMLEFGRGFGYKLPLSVTMQSLSSSLLKQIDAVSDRLCCNVSCKCSGHEGEKGLRGGPGPKGVSGQMGFPGFPGDEGVAGDRGRPGPSGPPGVEGCPGLRGQKGYRGIRGNRGEDGEDGLNGVNGEQGIPGKEGSKGAPGQAGDPGISGLRGEAGLTGQKGLRGDPGPSGADNTIPGPKGDAGNSGLPGTQGGEGRAGETGTVGNRGADGRRGAPGEKGPTGAPGKSGVTGTPGPSGAQGPRGVRGQPGPSGPQGLPGAQGGPGAAGGPGQSGRRGANGQKGQPGEPGEQGESGPQGPRGPPGVDGRDGYGPPGPAGPKGNPGFPGPQGLAGEDGLQGPKGFSGRQGNRGRGGNSGAVGGEGSPGEPGLPGHKGPRGPAGQRLNECEMLRYIRDNCACSYERVECPVVPTELVVGLDMSEDVTSEAFERQRQSLLSLLSSLTVSQSACPRGARVSIVAFSARTKYLLRFSDYSGKEQLLQAVRNIALEKTASKRRLGGAMRFVGHHVLKRVRSAHTLQKVALFFSNGATQDQEELVTAVMELRANDIIPVVMSLRTAPNVEKALKVDDSGKSIFSVLSRNEEENLKRINNCALCNDPCSPSPSCSFQDRPVSVDLDLALVLDGSREVPQDQFQGFQELLGSVVSQVSLSPSPQRPGPGQGQVRVGLVQMSGNNPTLEFGLDQYQNQEQVQDHLLHKVQQKRGSSALGQTLDFTLRQLLLRSSSPRRQKLLLLVLGTQSVSLKDRSRLDFVSQQALCEGVAIAVVTVGAGPNRTQVERLASPPVPQHLVQLVNLKGDQQDYTARFLRVLLSMITKRVNSYPPPSVQRSCGQFTGQTGQGPVIVDDQEVFEEEQERFQEHMGPGQVKTGLGQTGLGQTGLGQVDLVHTWTRGDGQTFETTAQSNALCALAVDSGVQCGDPVRRWFFAPALGACAPFWFGGCGGNANSFSSEHECLRTCEQQKVVLSQMDLLSEGACALEQDPGGCSDYSMMWFYDSLQTECSRFWFGGCGGNANRFKTQQECEALCVGAR